MRIEATHQRTARRALVASTAGVALVLMTGSATAVGQDDPPVTETTTRQSSDDGGDEPTSPTTTADPVPSTTATDGGSREDTTTSVRDVPTEDEVTTTVVPDSRPSDEADSEPVEIRSEASPTVSDSGIPFSSIVLAIVVLTAVASAVVLGARRRSERGTDTTEVGARPPATEPRRYEIPDDGTLAAGDIVTLDFLVEMGEALIDAGDAVSHVESTLARVAEVNGIEGLGVLVLPSALVLSLHVGDSVVTEVRTSGAGALRLDQIDDLLRLVQRAERAEVTASEGRRELDRIRTAAPSSATVLLSAYVISTIGLAMVLRGDWLEVVLAGVLGAVVGGLRLVTSRQSAAYQAFWPLIAAATVSAAAFAATRVVDGLAVFPVVVAPLITFLPGALLTIAVLELSTGKFVSGASRLAAGLMRLVLLSLGILAGASLVGVAGGDISSGGGGVVAAFAPWLGVALFGVGISRFNGAPWAALRWILVVLYVAYAGQVVGGLFFGSSLSAFFGALAMTPVALLASRQPSGPTPLVTFLPSFWLLVPGALGLEGVSLVIREGATGGADALATTLISMVGISFGLLLGLVVSGADPERPWSDSGDRTHSSGRSLREVTRWGRHGEEESRANADADADDLPTSGTR